MLWNWCNLLSNKHYHCRCFFMLTNNLSIYLSHCMFSAWNLTFVAVVVSKVPIDLNEFWELIFSILENGLI